MPTPDQLRTYPLFAGLSDEELAGIAPCVTKRAFAKGAYLYYPGSPGLNIYLVESGLIRVFFTNTLGREFLLNLVGPRTTLGLPFFRQDQTRMAGASALKPSVVLALAQQDLNDFTQRSPRFMQNIYRELDAMTRRLMLYAQGLATVSLNGRLANLFLTLNKEGGKQGNPQEIELPLSQAELATWVGASRGHLNRALGHLQELGLIRVEGQKYILLDRPGLQRLTGDLLVDQ